MTVVSELDSTKRQIENEMQAEIEARERRIAEQKRMILELAKTKQQIETDLKQKIDTQQIKLKEMAGKLRVTFVDKLLFDSGSTKINVEGQETLLKLAETLRKRQGQDIIVQGHTDDVPIRRDVRDRFPTNWELSTARATSVVRFLQDKAGIDPGRCIACGYSYYRPVATNNAEKGRRQNRRIEIILVPAR